MALLLVNQYFGGYKDFDGELKFIRLISFWIVDKERNFRGLETPGEEGKKEEN